MGRLRSLAKLVIQEARPLASAAKVELSSQLNIAQQALKQRIQDRFTGTASSSGEDSMSGSTSHDEWSFAAMNGNSNSNGPSVADAVAAAQAATAAAPAPEAASTPVAEAPAAPAAPVRITAQPSATDPALCRFTVEVPVFEERWIRVKTRELAEKSPLARRIFEIPQVTSVSFSGTVVSVTKSGPEPWQMIARQVGPIIRAHLASGEPAIAPDFSDLPQDAASNAEVARRIQEVIDNIINPGVAAHGGFVNLVSVEGDAAYIQFGGGCQGCGMASLTLKQGVTQTILSQVPEITQVLDATDHAVGENPYYAPQP